MWYTHKYTCTCKTTTAYVGNTLVDKHWQCTTTQPNQQQLHLLRINTFWHSPGFGRTLTSFSHSHCWFWLVRGIISALGTGRASLQLWQQCQCSDNGPVVSKGQVGVIRSEHGCMGCLFPFWLLRCFGTLSWVYASHTVYMYTSRGKCIILLLRVYWQYYIQNSKNGIEMCQHWKAITHTIGWFNNNTGKSLKSSRVA